MPSKLVGYFLLSFLSFCFFTILFNVLATAQVSAEQSAYQQVHPTLPIPTPTIYTAPQPVMNQQNTNSSPIATPTPTTSPSNKVPETSTQTTEQPPQVTATLVPPTATPTPTVIPTATPPQPTITTTTDLETLFSKYSAQYSVSEDELKKIAECESGFNTNSDTGVYVGMFQFSAETWASVRSLMGMDGSPDLRKNSDEAIKTAAFMLARGEQNAWPNCH